MQLSRDRSDANLILAWESGRLKIGRAWRHGHLIVAPDRIIADWTTAAPEELRIEHLRAAIELEPEIVLLGTGEEMLLPDTALIAALAERGIGLEIMDTPAACRTYNVLVHEQRHVVAALFNFGRAAATD